jgi:hypothetical protein
VDDGEERSQSKNSAFGPKRHEAFDAVSQKRVVETARVPGNGAGITPQVYGEVRFRNGSRILPPAD